MENENLAIVEKHPRLIRACHWLNFPLLFVMIWSGILIYWAHTPYVEIPDKLGPLEIHHRLAEGMGWHFFLMWPFFINGIVYVLYLVITGEWRELWPGFKTFPEAFQYILYDLKLKRDPPPQRGKFNAAQRLAYTSAILMGMGAIITGLAIYKPVQLGWLTSFLGGYEAARFEHFILMNGFLLFFVLHIIQVIRAGWNNFRAMVAGYEIKK